MDPFAAVQLGLTILEVAERIHGARIEAAKREEAEAVAVHLDRTRAAQAVIASVSFAE